MGLISYTGSQLWNFIFDDMKPDQTFAECVKPIYNIFVLSVNENSSFNFASGSFCFVIAVAKYFIVGLGVNLN